jgi:hypothetical protein
MLRPSLASFLVCLGCGGGGGGSDPGVDAPVSAACLEAETYQDLPTIEDKIFKSSCIFSGCHNGQATDAGRINLRAGMAHAALVNVPSEVDTPNRLLVVPGQPKQSYLLLILGHYPPDQADPPTVAPPGDVGLMPQATGGVLLCREKRDAVERWIVAGALP